MSASSASATGGHVFLVHEDAGLVEDFSRWLSGSGHRISAPVIGRRIAQTVIDAAPDLLAISAELRSPPAREVARAVRQALGAELRILAVYREKPVPPLEEADEVLCGSPPGRDELLVRVSRLLGELAEKRALRKKSEDLLGLYKMSWAFSLAGGAEALFGHIARHSAEVLKAARGVVVLYERDRRQLVAQPPGFGLERDQIGALRWAVDAEADALWNFRRNGPLVSNKAQADTRLLKGLVEGLGIQSLMLAPITRGPEIQGLLAVADRPGGVPFNDDDLALLIALAGQATVAVENLRLHEELKRANERLQEYDRLKSEFVGIVAHDFRKPLMAIRGFAELVLEEPDLGAETRQEFMRTVISETEHLALLANDTLLITQIETGQFRYQFQAIETGPFLLDAVPMGLSEHSVLLDVPPTFPEIFADPERLRQVIVNLVSNALKYSPPGASIVVRARQRGSDHVVFEVEDHGIGIPSDQISRLFRKFERVRTTEHLGFSGTGLGLYICRLIVEGHGGQIWVESEVGRGSTFGFTLPLDARVAARPNPSITGEFVAIARPPVNPPRA